MAQALIRSKRRPCFHDRHRLIGGWRHGTSRPALGKLILYDLLILWKSGRAAFSRKRDLLLLAVAAIVGLLIAIQGAGAAAAALGALPILATAGIAAASALVVNLAAARRLAHLRQESVVARHALRRPEALAHALLWNLPPLLAMTALIVVSSRPLAAAAAIALGYVFGILLAAAQRAAQERLRNWWGRRQAAAGARRRALAGNTRRDRIVQLLMARTGLAGQRIAANLLLFAGLGLVIGLSHGWLAPRLDATAAGAIVGMLTLLVCLFLLRTQPRLLRYLLYLGSSPMLPALVASALAAAFVAGLLIGMTGSAPAPPLPMLAAAAALVLLFLAAALLGTLHHATKSRQSAEIAIQVDLVAAGLIGFLAMPLAVLALAARLWVLARRAHALRYISP